MAAKLNGTLIRINLRDFEGPKSKIVYDDVPSFIPISLGGKQALMEIEEALKNQSAAAVKQEK